MQLPLRIAAANSRHCSTVKFGDCSFSLVVDDLAAHVTHLPLENMPMLQRKREKLFLLVRPNIAVRFETRTILNPFCDLAT
jgi:hypothetical protein